jgi:hypothetical protein
MGPVKDKEMIPLDGMPDQTLPGPPAGQEGMLLIMGLLLLLELAPQ